MGQSERPEPTFVFEHRVTKKRIRIKAPNSYDAWTKLRTEHNHLKWLRVGVRAA